MGGRPSSSASFVSHFVLRTASIGTLLFAAACGSSTKTVTAPSPVKCELRLQTPSSAFAASGGSGTLQVTTGRECAWSARADTAWLSLAAPMEGQGDGTVKFNVGSNSEPSARSGGIDVNDQRVEISQQGRPCEFRLSSTREEVDADGGVRSLDVGTSGTQCEWTARADVDWITIAAGSRGTGTGTVTFRVEPVSGPSRTGTLTVAGQQVHVEQGVGCTYSVSAVSLTAPAAGGTLTIPVSTQQGCAWTAENHVPWITITAGSRGTGNGTVTLRVEPVSGPSRTGTLTVAGQRVYVEQGTGCTYSLSAVSFTAPAAGGTLTIPVSTQQGCAWTAASHVAWITITSGTGNTGPGAVELRVGPTDGPTRTGSLTIAGRTVTVDQSPGCAYAVNPLSLSVPASGGSGVVSVQTAGGCPWSAALTVNWITLVSGASGTGPGEVRFTVGSSTGPARQATVTVAGRVVSISQASGCTFDIAPRQSDVAGTGGGGAVSITTGAGCSWAASSRVEWIGFSTSGGTGPGQVQFTVAPNASPPRSSTATVAGLPFVVNQSSLCTFPLVPAFLTYDAGGGNGAVLVIVSGACTWTAASSVDWITMTSGLSGTGEGVVQFRVAPNPGPSRSGYVVIAGQNFPVQQSGR